MIVDRVTDLIGDTPLLRLATPGDSATVLLKLEQFNPTGTAKIRMARQMVDDAEEHGLLAPGGWIVESTSGNTGMGLALVAAERGYRFSAVVDGHSSPDKLRAMTAFGADLVDVGGDAGELSTGDRDATAAKLAVDGGAYWTEQHHNPANAAAYRGLARELRQALGDDVDYLFGAVGTGGSLCGTGRVLREDLPDLRIVGVEPVGSVVFGGPPGTYRQSGTGTPEGAEIGELVDYDLITEGLQVGDREAFETCRYLAREFGVLVGGSAGGVIYKAIERARLAGPSATIVVLVCDGGDKYLDTVFDDAWMTSAGLLDAEVVDRLSSLLGH
jgi:cystathionine beta-synthase